MSENNNGMAASTTHPKDSKQCEGNNNSKLVAIVGDANIASRTLGASTLLSAAISLASQGYSCIPLKPNKAANLPTWKGAQAKGASRSELESHFGYPLTKGLGVVCGQVSGNLEVVDIDCKYDISGTLYDDLCKEIESRMPGFAYKLRIIKTLNGGYHFLFKCKVIEGSRKLASRPSTEAELKKDPKDKVKVLIETKGEGGYVATVPTPGYEIIQDCPVPLITVDERETLLNICRSFNELITPVKSEHGSTETEVFKVAPWDDYNHTGQSHMQIVLERNGWKVEKEFGTKKRYTRPGKNEGVSAEYDRTANVFYVFTSSSIFESGKGYSPAAVFAMLEYEGDFRASAKALESEGYGTRNEKSPKKDFGPGSSATLVVDVDEWIHNNYTLRRNEITRNIEHEGKPLQQKDLNTIYLKCKTAIPKASYDIVDRTINSNSTPSYNPLKDFFDQNKDRKPSGAIKALIDTVETDTGLSGSDFYPLYMENYITKWLVGIISSVYGEHSPLMLVLSGNLQGTGKTEWLRRLLPAQLRAFYAESKLDAGKDDEILMTQKLLIADDEMSGKSKKDERRVKELLSKQQFSLREPYGRNNVDLQRLAVLCGTTNDSEILSDPTGNRRIIPVNVLSIDHEAYNIVDKVDVLVEAYHLFKSGFKWQLSSEDVKVLNKNTSGFEQISAERDLLIKNYRMAKAGQEASFLTPTEVKSTLERRSQQKINVMRLGLELKKWGVEKVARKINGSVVRGYYLIDREVAGLLEGWQQGDNRESPST